MRGDRPEPYLMTTREVAELLRLKERKIYDLVASGDIPHIRVSGKFLFARTMIEAWLADHSHYGPGIERLMEPPPVLAGSHDPLLEWALVQSGAGLPTLLDSSIDGLRRMQQGEAIAAGVHVSEAGAYNTGTVQRYLAGRPVVLIEWAKRRQGLLVADGNPLDLTQVADLRGRRLALRQPGAGSFILLEWLLNQADMKLDDLSIVDQPVFSDTELARAVAEGRADAGIGLEAMASVHGLGFVPLATESFDIAMWRRAWFEPPMQKLFAFTATRAFRVRAAELGGYDVSRTGQVRYNAP